LSLAISCITYLCQPHHDPNLSDDQIRKYVLSGAYRMHDVASLLWIELVDKCTRSNTSDTFSKELMDLIRLLIEERKNDSYVSPSETLDRLRFKSLEILSLPVRDNLCEIFQFRQTCAQKDYSRSKGLLMNPFHHFHSSNRFQKLYGHV
jgi:hypothetical protein